MSQKELKNLFLIISTCDFLIKCLHCFFLPATLTKANCVLPVLGDGRWWMASEGCNLWPTSTSQKRETNVLWQSKSRQKHKKMLVSLVNWSSVSCLMYFTFVHKKGLLALVHGMTHLHCVYYTKYYYLHFVQRLISAYKRVWKAASFFFDLTVWVCYLKADESLLFSLFHLTGWDNFFCVLFYLSFYPKQHIIGWWFL